MSRVHTYTGRDVDPFDLRVVDVTLEDHVRSLARQCRFNGHLREPYDFYSVLEHEVLVRRLAQRDGASVRLQLLCMLHEGGEVYLGDVVTPVKDSLVMKRDGASSLSLRRLDNEARDTVFYALGLSPPSIAEENDITQYDGQAFQLERDTMQRGSVTASVELIRLLGDHGLNPRAAERLWMEDYLALSRQLQGARA